jgi:hypothetical protein
LTQLAARLEADVNGAKDAVKVRMVAKAVSDLADASRLASRQ